MSETATPTQPGSTPVVPPQPDASGLGRTRRRGSRVASAGNKSATGTAPTDTGRTETAQPATHGTAPTDTGRTETAQPATHGTAPTDTGRTETAQPATHGTAPTDTGRTETAQPATHGTAPTDTGRTETAQPATHGTAPTDTGRTETAQPATHGTAVSLQDASASEGVGQQPVIDAGRVDDSNAEESSSFSENASEDSPSEGFNESDWIGKATKSAYVPPSIAVRVKEMQQTGLSAEKIVLNAVLEAADKLAELKKDARGPVHDANALFPGLEVIKRNPGRPVKVEMANSRLQFGLTPAYIPALRKLAKKHNLNISSLVRISLGDYFNIPVRLHRAQ